MQGQPADAHTVEFRSVIPHGLLGLVEAFVVGFAQVGVEHAVLVRNRRVVNPQRCARSQKRPLQHLLIIIEIFTRGTIVTGHKTLHQAVRVLVRIPHQISDHIGAKLREIGSFRPVHLLKEHIGMMLLEDLDVLLQNMQVGKRCHHVIKINSIIPYKKVFGNAAPAFQCLHKLLTALIIGQWHLAPAIDIAQHDVDIGQRLHVLGRHHGEQIGQRRELLVGITLSQFVQKADVIARKCAFFDVHGSAFIAMAVGVVSIVLTD